MRMVGVFAALLFCFFASSVLQPTNSECIPKHTFLSVLMPEHYWCTYLTIACRGACYSDISFDIIQLDSSTSNTNVSQQCSTGGMSCCTATSSGAEYVLSNNVPIGCETWDGTAWNLVDNFEELLQYTEDFLVPTECTCVQCDTGIPYTGVLSQRPLSKETCNRLYLTASERFIGA